MGLERFEPERLLKIAVQGRSTAEIRAIASDLRLSTLFGLVGHIPFTADQAGSLTSIDREWQIRTGQSMLESCFQGWVMALHPDDVSGALAQWRKAIDGSSTLEMDFRARHIDGRYRWYRARAAPFREVADGSLIWHGTFEDVDRHYQSAAEHAQTQSALIHLSRLSAMGTMASTLAHELNQPLTAITGFVRAARRLVEGGDGSDDTREALTGADSAAIRAGEIVRRVRMLVVSGQVEKRRENIAQLIYESVDILSYDARAIGVTIHIAVADELAEVMVDRVQIQQVLLNLIRNAIEALAWSERKLIDVTVSGANSDFCKISVHDSGPGIAPEVASRLFELFNTSKSTGSGIGLSICRTIVEAHGGNIQHVPSDRGTEISFKIPFVDQDSGYSSAVIS